MIEDQEKWEVIKKHVNGCAYYQLRRFEAVEVSPGYARFRMPAVENFLQF